MKLFGVAIFLLIIGGLIIYHSRKNYVNRVYCWFKAESGDSARAKKTEMGWWWKNFRNPPAGTSKREILDSQIDYWNARTKYRPTAIFMTIIGISVVGLGVLIFYIQYGKLL